MCVGVRQGFWKWLSYGTVVGAWVVALAFIGIGIYLAVESPHYEYESLFPGATFDTAVWETPVYLTISLAVAMVGIGFLGFCGARKEKRTYLLLYFVPGAVIAALLLTSAIMAGVWATQVKDNMVGVMADQLWSDYAGPDAPDSVSKDWNNLQQDLKCCGAYYFADYRLYSKFYQDNKDENLLVPNTCCRGEEENYLLCLDEASGRNGTGGDFVKPVYLFTEGCYWAMVNLVEEQSTLIISTLCIGAAVQAGAVFFTCMLRGNLKLLK